MVCYRSQIWTHFTGIVGLEELPVPRLRFVLLLSCLINSSVPSLTIPQLSCFASYYLIFYFYVLQSLHPFLRRLQVVCANRMVQCCMISHLRYRSSIPVLSMFISVGTSMSHYIGTVLHDKPPRLPISYTYLIHVHICGYIYVTLYRYSVAW